MLSINRITYIITQKKLSAFLYCNFFCFKYRFFQDRIQKSHYIFRACFISVLTVTSKLHFLVPLISSVMVWRISIFPKHKFWDTECSHNDTFNFRLTTTFSYLSTQHLMAEPHSKLCVSCFIQRTADVWLISRPASYITHLTPCFLQNCWIF